MPQRTVEPRYLPFQVFVPANTAQASSISLNLDCGPVVVESIQVTVPTGHAGLTGLGIDYDGVRILPWGDSSSFLVADGVDLAFDVDFEVGHPLVARAFNTDEVFDHSFYLRVRVRDIGQRTASGSVPLILTT